MKKILFFIRSLNAGGAERQLVLTAIGLAERGHDVTVLSFYSGGFYEDKFKNTKVQLLNLRKKGRWDLFGFIFRLLVVLHRQAPEVIYSFLSTANILIVLLRPFIPLNRVVWGVRSSDLDLRQYDWLARLNYKVECRLARFADIIIANSRAGLAYAVENDFPSSKMVVIPNGIDTVRFRPDKKIGARLREEWNITEEERLIGVVGRIDSMKGHAVFLKTAALIKQRQSNVRFVCVGKGEAGYERAVHALATEMHLDDVLIWAGIHSDMVAVYNAFDVLCSPSFSEGFPNVVGEAMACGVPCVVTDAGDSAWIVGDSTRVVGLGDPEKLAKAICNALDLMTDIDFADMSRTRIEENFSLKRLFDLTEHQLCGD